MPQPIRLPDGRTIFLSDDPIKAQAEISSIYERYSGRAPRDIQPRLPSFMQQDKPGSLLDPESNFERFISAASAIPSGIVDTASSIVQSGLAVATPFADLPLEKSLREAAARRAATRDPRYTTSSAVGAGLGQVGVMTGLSFMGPYGRLASRGVGMALNINDAANRIASYEERTGINVPWYKETLAHLTGAAIGITEQMPLRVWAGRGSVGNMLARINAGTARSGFRSTVAAVGAEGAQEAMANLMQSLTARGLYDKDAMKDVISASYEDAKVGGIVGGIANATTRLILGKYNRYFNPSAADIQAEEFLRKRQQKDWRSVRESWEQLDPNAITSDLQSIISETDITQGLADDITRALGAQKTPLPFGLEGMLREGNIDLFNLNRLIQQSRTSTENLLEELKQSEEGLSGRARLQYKQAQDVVTQIMQPRLQKLYELRDKIAQRPTGGGLQDLQSYNGRKAQDINDADQLSVKDMLPNMGVRDPGAPQSAVVLLMKDLFGGGFGLGAYYNMAEKLGAHRSVGADQSRQAELATEGADPNFSSSSEANFEAPTISAYIFGDIDPEKGHSIGEFDLPYLGQESDIIKKLNADIDAINQADLNAQKENPLTKRAYEAKVGRKISDSQWATIANANLGKIQESRRALHEQLAAKEGQRSEIYLRALNKNLLSVLTASQANPAIIERGAERLGMSANQFVQWLNGMSQRVQAMASVSESNKLEVANALTAALKQAQQGDPSKTLAELRKQLKEDGTEERLRAKYASHKREFSAADAINLTKLFNSEVESDAALNQMFAMRASADLSSWIGDNDRFVSIGRSPVPLRDDTQIKVIKEFFDTYNPEKKGVSQDDIERLLASKNIKLRDSLASTSLGADIGTGVESRPFRKLLQDLTGADSWSTATEGQKYFMYSRLAQLPPMYAHIDRGKQMGSLRADYDAIYLPDFYSDPRVERLYKPLLNIIYRSQEGLGVDPAWDNLNTGDPSDFYDGVPISAILQYMQEGVARRNQAFQPRAVSEALAQLIETRVLRVDGDKILINNVDPPGNELLFDPISGRFDERQRQAREDLDWENFVDPLEIERKLLEEDVKDTVDELLEAYNIEAEARGDRKYTREEFVRQFAGELSKMTGKSELKRLGLLGSVGQSLIAEIEPTQNQLLQLLKSKQGRDISRALVTDGILPVQLQDGLHNLRGQYINRIKTTYEVFKKEIETVLDDLAATRGLKLEFVDQFGGVFQALEEVGINNIPSLDSRVAMYDTVGGRILINLANIDPNRVMSSLEVIKEAAFHEGLHSLDIRDMYDETERRVLYNYARNEIVPEEVDPTLHEAGLTWMDRSILKHSNSQLSEGDIAAEAVIDVLTNLSMDNIPEAKTAGKIGLIERNLNKLLTGVIDAADTSNITELLQVFRNIRSGKIGERGAGYMGVEAEAPEYSIRSLRLTEYADPAEVEQLKDALRVLNSASTPQEKTAAEATVDKLTKTITSRKTEIQNTAPKVTMPQTIEELEERIRSMNSTYPGAVPLMGKMGKDNLDAYRVAINEFMTRRNGDMGYVMPAEQQFFFENQTNLGQRGQQLVKSLLDKGLVNPTEGDPIRDQFQDDGTASGEILGNNPEEVAQKIDATTRDVLRYNFLDRRQWAVKQTQRLLAKQNMAMLDAKTSALVGFRNSDSAVNLLPGLMRKGPLKYTGATALSGQFLNVPVYNEALQEKYGGDGQIPGLAVIMHPIRHKQDQYLASMYGEVKRIVSKKRKLDEVKALVSAIPPGVTITPELQASLDLAQYKYDAANPRKGKKRIRKWSNKDIQKVISTVEDGIVLDRNGRVVEEGDSGHIARFWDYYQAFNSEMIRFAYQTGLISLDVRDEWLQEDYMPFYRETHDGTSSLEFGSEEQIKKRGENLVEKALTESLAPIDRNIFESINTNIQALVRDGLMNVAVSRVARDSMELGEATLVSTGELGAKADARIIRVMEQGVATFYRLDDAQLAMSSMLAGHNPRKTIEKLLGEGTLGKTSSKYLTGAAQLLRTSVTKTPPFMLKNVLRDSFQAMILTGGDPSIIVDAVRNALDRGTRDRAAELGLSIGIDFVAEPGKFDEKLASEFNRYERMQKNWTAGDGITNPFSLAWDALCNLAEQSESATRLAVYDRVLAQTGDKALAQNMALEIMNYGRRGASPYFSTWLSTVPFMNGRLQGLDVVWRGHMGHQDIPNLERYGKTQSEYDQLRWTQKQMGMVWSRGAALALASLIYEVLMDMGDEDDDYRNLRDDVKFDNWVLPISKNNWLKIPIPFEIGTIYKVIPQIIYKLGTDATFDLKDAGGEVRRQMRNTLSIGWPQMFGPMLDAMANKNRYRGDEIVSYYDQQLESLQQRDMYTSDTAILGAELASVLPGINQIDWMTSPMKLSYWMYNQGGTMVSYVVKIADRILRSGIVPFVDKKSVAGTPFDFDFDSLFTGEGIANMPMFGDLTLDKRRGGGLRQGWFDLEQEGDRVVNTANAIGERDRYKGWLYEEEHRALLEYRGLLAMTTKKLELWRSARDAIFKRKDLNLDEKRIRMYNLYEVEKDLLRQVPSIMKSIKSQQKLYDKLKKGRPDVQRNA